MHTLNADFIRSEAVFSCILSGSEMFAIILNTRSLLLKRCIIALGVRIMRPVPLMYA